MRGPLALLDAALEGVDVWSDRVSKALYRVAVDAALPALMLIVTLDVVLRYVFNSPLPWGRDVNGLLLLITIFSALPHAWDRGYHIRMEVFYNRLPGRARNLADVATAAAGILFLGLMGIQALRFTIYMAATGETGEDLLLPFWPFMAYMGFCSLVLAARLIGNPSGEEQIGLGAEAPRTVPNGELLTRPSARELSATLAIEVAAVAAAQDIPLAFTDPVAAAEQVAERTAANNSSMLQDVQRGAPTEIDAICGAVVRNGEAVGVPTPANQTLWRLVSALRDAIH